MARELSPPNPKPPGAETNQLVPDRTFVALEAPASMMPPARMQLLIAQAPPGALNASRKEVLPGAEGPIVRELPPKMKPDPAAGERKRFVEVK